ncbi:MAG: ferrous iron transport protein B [Bacteroidales bacterium OttesenSCG-928-I14]|jgi:ferrous iron transport protein B|nr:ferrous iron transport protein B [Bacteroidales bacterium OttesenSCG-928-I14]
MELLNLLPGQKGIIIKVRGRRNFRKKIIEMGFVYGQKIEVIAKAPLQDPINYRIMDYEISLRKSEAKLIDIITEKETKIELQEKYNPLIINSSRLEELANDQKHTIKLILIGNPNSGKTSLFNIVAHKYNRVGNYPGVTVDPKESVFKYKKYTFNFIDLPGTYSLSAYSHEEIYVRKYIYESSPDIVVNVVAASNLERNLYLTTQLIDMDTTMVIALNMYDELEKSGNILDHQCLSKMIGCPIIPTTAKSGKGTKKLLDKIIEVYEGKNHCSRHIHIYYGTEIEKSIQHIKCVLRKENIFGNDISHRFLSIQLLEHNKFIETIIKNLPNKNAILSEQAIHTKHIENDFGDNTETIFTNARYGFIKGALKETYQKINDKQTKSTCLIDKLVMHRFLSYPIFFAFMFIMFECTFFFGKYPVKLIELIIQKTSEFIEINMVNGPLKDLFIHGIIGGVGNVIIFIPNIIILYIFISFMEDSGYMSRAVFIMDKLMHKIGLHGKSFIPFIMGFGCNVPAIMSTRIIESYNTRLITMLVNPLISCSARLPIYILFISAFFPNHAGLLLFILYATGIIIAILMAIIIKKFLIKHDDFPFVMELPPYRIPTWKATQRHVLHNISQYLWKMSGTILISAIIIWFLGYFPKKNAQYYNNKITELALHKGTKNQILHIKNQQNEERKQNSFIGHIGHFIEPFVKPLGFDWKLGTCLISGLPAKEIIISTLGILYNDSGNDNFLLKKRLQTEKDFKGNLAFTPLKALSFLFFVLLYSPCIATITSIKNESGKLKWAIFTVIYTTSLAWLISFIIYQIGSLII